jgi:hypothetical protein
MVRRRGGARGQFLMGLIYQLEPWRDCIEEIKPFLTEHAREFNDEPSLVVDFDFERYGALSDAGLVRCMTGRRRSGELRAYAWIFVSEHLHYRGKLCATMDIYYVVPSFRSGAEAVRLFRNLEDLLAAEGVVKLYAGTRPWKDATPVFKRCGWSHVEIGFSKFIGG